jgi:phospholipid/cholesterol/gamma-HCH transport system ATP-binding protein
VLRIRGISRAFGDRRVLCGVDLDVQTSQLLGMIGPSGGGKSTLVKILASTCRADAGSVEFLGAAPDHDVALMFQEGALFDSLSVYDNVAFPLVKGRVPTTRLPKAERSVVCEKVSEILARVGLSKAANKMPAQLSGGMRRRVSLARALVARPAYLLLDDPTSGLDPVASSVIMNLIAELHREYRPTTVIVSHDLRRLLPVVEQVVALFGGKIAFEGTLADLRANPDPQIRGFVSCRFDMKV